MLVNGRTAEKTVQGTYTYEKGEWKEDQYEGEWKKGEKDGHGTYTWSVGSKYVGEFKNGNFWKGTEYDKDGNIFGKWVNGVFQK